MQQVINDHSLQTVAHQKLLRVKFFTCKDHIISFASNRYVRTNRGHPFGRPEPRNCETNSYSYTPVFPSEIIRTIHFRHAGCSIHCIYMKITYKIVLCEPISRLEEQIRMVFLCVKQNAPSTLYFIYIQTSHLQCDFLSI